MQLFREIEFVKLPSTIGYRDPNLVTYRTHNKFYHLVWPNGVPCALANEWLRQNSQKKGTYDRTETCRTYASHLSFLLRYCFKYQIEIFDFHDKDVGDLVTYLKEETRIKNGIVSDRRTNNQIITILQTIFRFFRWIQTHIMLNVDPIFLGDESSGAQIHVTIGINPRTGQTTYTHDSMPDSVPPKGDKIPIADEYISSLRDTISSKFQQSLSSANTAKEPAKFDLRQIKSKYIYERRMFSVMMQKISGLRPMELCLIPVDKNTNVIGELAIYLPTGKTRNRELPLRKFPLSIAEANRIKKYLDARSDFLSHFDPAILNSSAAESILLTDGGKPLSEQSLTRDFSRLVVSAGLGNVKLCLSMFRHKFITVEILLEMQRTTKSAKVAAIWNEGIRHSICAIVSAKTGHTNPASLYTYFNDAHKFSTKFNTYGDAVEHLRQVDDKIEALTYQRYEILRALASGQVDQEFAEKTLKFISDMQADFEAIKTIALKT